MNVFGNAFSFGTGDVYGVVFVPFVRPRGSLLLRTAAGTFGLTFAIG